MGTEEFTSFQKTIEHIRKNMKKIQASYMRSHGLRSAHTTFLLALDTVADGLTVTQLSKECGVDKALMTRLSSELYAKGYISLYHLPKDKKGTKRFVLTRWGKALIADMKIAIDEFVQQANAAVPEEQRRIFDRVLSALDASIAQIADTAAVHFPDKQDT